MVGLTAYGGYVPRLRLSRRAAVTANAWFNPGLRALAKGERSMCNWDEDSLTMAVEAARDCLAGGLPAKPEAIYLASTTLPFADRSCAGVLATALNLGEELATLDLTTSQRAGTSALISALAWVSGGGGTALLVAGERRRTKAAGPQELLYGDGAAALAVGSEGVIADYLGSHQIAVDFVDHYRGQSETFDYHWEERWVRDEGYLKIVPRALAGLLEKTGVAPAEVDHFVMPCVIRGVPGRIADRAGLRREAVRDTLAAGMGESGAAHALVMLAHTLEEAKPGETILVVGWGQGCDALMFRTTEAIGDFAPRLGIGGHLARRREETNYQKFLAFNNLVTSDGGLRSEGDKQTALSTLYRKRSMVLGLVGGKCRVCGTAQFPKSNICVNPNCGALHSQDDFPFADRPAKILTWTADNLTYTADPPAHYGMIEFLEGGRLLADFTDVDPGAVAVDMPMRMMFRVKEHDPQRGFRKYFWKAAPEAAPA